MEVNGLKWRCPDKPVRSSQDSLGGFDREGGYIATHKYDGWRCLIDWDGGKAEFYSARDVTSGGPTKHNVSESLIREVEEFFRENGIPPSTRLDSEWLARRTDGPQEIRIFGIQYLGGEWLGSDIEDLRWTIIETYQYNQPHVKLAESTRQNFVEFFKDIKSRENLVEGKQKTEGIVLKKESSKLYGNLKTHKKNMGWFKIKWRDGASGYGPTF